MELTNAVKGVPLRPLLSAGGAAATASGDCHHADRAGGVRQTPGPEDTSASGKGKADLQAWFNHTLLNLLISFKTSMNFKDLFGSSETSVYGDVQVHKSVTSPVSGFLSLSPH